MRVGRDADDDAVQKVNVLLDKVKLLLLTVVPPETEPVDVMYEYAPFLSFRYLLIASFGSHGGK